MTKREITARAKQYHDELEMLSFAVALADVELPLAKAAAYAIRDGAHTEEEALAILARIANRLIPQIEMMRGADEAEEERKESGDAEADQPSPIITGSSRIILPH